MASHYAAETRRDAEFYKQVFRDASDPHAFRAWLHRILGGGYKFDIFPDYGYATIETGLLTYLHLLLALHAPQKLFCELNLKTYAALRQFYQREFGLACIIRTERLLDDLIEALHLAGYQVNGLTEERIRHGGKTNASSRQLSLEDAYDSESAALVANVDRLIIERYGYQFLARSNEF